METLLILAIFIFLFIVSYLLLNFYLKENKYAKYNPFKVEVPRKTAYVLDRFGTIRILNEGFQDYFPFIDEIEAIVSLKVEVVYPDKLEVFTLDNEKINLDYRVFYKVTDPLKALNNVYDYKGTLRSLIIISTLNVISNTRLVNIKTNTIQKIREDIEKESLNWGIEIPRILFDSVSIP
jgi:regulator of protease activity HflC (stomatin/prohibitin superfamily)